MMAWNWALARASHAGGARAGQLDGDRPLTGLQLRVCRVHGCPGYRGRDPGGTGGWSRSPASWGAAPVAFLLSAEDGVDLNVVKAGSGWIDPRLLEYPAALEFGVTLMLAAVSADDAEHWGSGPVEAVLPFATENGKASHNAGRKKS